MSCVLKVIGEDLDPDDFVDRLQLKGFQKEYKGAEVTPKRSLKYSYVMKLISNEDNFNEQRESAYRFLNRHKKKIKKVCTIKEIQYFVIDFNVTSTIDNKHKLVQSIYFDKKFIDLCSELHITFEVTFYAIDLQSILEKNYQERQSKLNN